MMMIAESLADGAVMMGLKRDTAYKIVKKMIYSSATLLEDNHPALIKDMIMSVKGTTAYGYYELEKSGIRGALIEAVRGSVNRANSLKSKKD